jgi:hypothetical protein
MIKPIQPRSLGLQLLESLMAPLVRFCLSHGFSIQDFIDTAKVAFMKLASEEITKVGKRPNVSRVSVMTGLNRTEATRLFRGLKEPSEGPADVPARVMAHWQHQRRFRSTSGRPLSLTYRGDNSEFRRLVETVSKNVNPGTVLFELERKGMIKRTPQKVTLIRQVYATQANPLQAFQLLAGDFQTLLDAGEENVFGPEELMSNLHIRTEFDNIVKNKLPAIRKWLVEEGKAFHKRAREFLSGMDRDLSPQKDQGEAGARVSLTSFSFSRDK